MNEPARSYRNLVRDEEVEDAQAQLVAAALEQPKPSRRLRQALNALLALVGHPLATKAQS